MKSHLELRCRHDLESDLANNYADDVVLLAREGVYRGLDGVREAAGVLARCLPQAHFEYGRHYVEGDYAYLEWRARSDEGHVTDGSDAYVIRDGRIALQMVHYVVKS